MSRKARVAIADPHTAVFISIASAWEIQIKATFMKLTLNESVDALYRSLVIDLRGSPRSCFSVWREREGGPRYPCGGTQLSILSCRKTTSPSWTSSKRPKARGLCTTRSVAFPSRRREATTVCGSSKRCPSRGVSRDDCEGDPADGARTLTCVADGSTSTAVVEAHHAARRSSSNSSIESGKLVPTSHRWGHHTLPQSGLTTATITGTVTGTEPSGRSAEVILRLNNGMDA